MSNIRIVNLASHTTPAVVEDNRKEWEKLKFYGKNKLEEYYQNIDYMKRRFGQEQK